MTLITEGDRQKLIDLARIVAVHRDNTRGIAHIWKDVANRIGVAQGRWLFSTVSRRQFAQAHRYLADIVGVTSHGLIYIDDDTPEPLSRFALIGED